MATKPLRAILWIAVSSKAQAEDDKTSLPAQEAAARAICQREGWQVVDVLTVPGHSRNYIDIHEMAAAMRAERIFAVDDLLKHFKARDFDVLVVRDTERFARTQSAHSYIIESTILKAGARIFSLVDGWIDENNYNMQISMGGYKAASDIRRVVKNRVPTLHKIAQRGIPHNASNARTHILIRDASGRPAALVVNERLRPLLDDATALLIEGVSYNAIERQLFERFGHINPRTGRAYAPRTIYQWLHNPTTWGHQVVNLKGVDNGQRKGTWAFDESVPVPEGVTVYRNTHPPVFEGKQAERIKLELRRRNETVRGSARPYRTKRFSGLLLCDACGFHLAYNGGEGYPYYRCNSRYSARSRPGCDVDAPLISERSVQYWFDRNLRLMLADADPAAILPTEYREKRTSAQVRLTSIQHEIATITEQAHRLIEKQSTAPEILRDAYDDQINIVAAQLESAKQALARLEREAAREDTQAQKRAYDEIAALEIDEFWRLPDTKINQILHGLLAGMRLVVRDKYIVGAIEAPPRVHWRRGLKGRP